MADKKVIAQVWTFGSSSSKTGKTHETIEYVDGSTSCNCPGWTRRVDSNGNRSCKHTRGVDMGSANSNCINYIDYTIKKEKVEKEVGIIKTNGGNRPEITNRLANI